MNWNDENAKLALAKLRKRASCRSFENREISNEILTDILSTGLTAASGGNLQPLSIIVVKDELRKKKLCEINGNQTFIEQAPVNLVFVLDWYKMSVFAKHRKAPYACYKSYMHFLIALEDVMCAAQIVESAAFLYGIGSCYVGTTNHCGAELSELLNLPEYTYPVLLLSLGYPKAELKVRKKLDYDVMIFDEVYPDKGACAPIIIEKYEKKYEGQKLELPKNNEDRKAEMLNMLRSALLTAYSEEEADEIILEVEQNGYLNETQRVFGLHYVADEMIGLGKEIMDMMEKQGLVPFDRA